MRRTYQILALALPVVFAAACTQLSSEDRALLLQTQNTANAAQAEASKAAVAAQNAAAAAQSAAADAKAANEKADRMFARTQRKTVQ